MGSTQPIERKTAVFHFVFLLIISLLFIGILPGLAMLFFEKAEETTIKQRRKGLLFKYSNKLNLQVYRVDNAKSYQSAE